MCCDGGDFADLREEGKIGVVVWGGENDCRTHTLINNPRLWPSMGEDGRAEVEKKFKLDRLVAETLAAYHSAGWENP